MNFEFDERDRESVRRDLESPDEEVRRLAVERVTVLQVGESIARLVERIGDSSWRVRKSAVERLVVCSDYQEAVAALIRALADGENTGRRNSAVEALVEFGGRAVPQLLHAMGDHDPDVRKLVVDALAGIGDPRCSDALVAGLRDLDANVRAAVAEALGAIGGDAAVRALHEVAVREDEDQLVRFSALHAMASLEVPLRASDLAPVLGHEVLRPAGLALLGYVDDAGARSELLKALGAKPRTVRETAIASLLRTLARLDGAAAERLTEEIRAAAGSTPMVVENAIERLSDGNLGTGLMLIQFLGIVGSRDAVVPLLRAAQDEALNEIALANLEFLGPVAEEAIDAAWSELDVRTRRDACILFGRMSGAASAVRLAACIDDCAPEIRGAAASSAGARGMVDTLPLLLRRLEQAAQDDGFESEEEMDLLTRALIELAGRQEAGHRDATRGAIGQLTAALEGATPPVRLAIATVIGRVGGQAEAPVIELLLKDPSAQVRRAAVDALAHLDHGTAAESLRLALADEAPKVRIAAASALGASRSGDVIGFLRCLADDDDADVRAAAVRAVASRGGEWADTEQAAALIDAALEDEGVVALAAIEALCCLGEAGALRATRALDRPEVELVQAAVRWLGERGEVATLDVLLPLVSHPEWTVRAETIQVLADRGVTKAVPPVLRRLETEQDEFVRDAMLRALDRLGG
jgi:HEAT repeat protein